MVARHAACCADCTTSCPPAAQDKLVRVVRGRVFDVAVDIRKASPTYGKWTGLELSAEHGNQILVPKGFAHGFVTLEPDTEIIYKVTAPYSREHERAIRFDDPDIGIEWPVAATRLMLSPKDRAAPLLREQDSGLLMAEAGTKGSHHRHRRLHRLSSGQAAARRGLQSCSAMTA